MQNRTGFGLLDIPTPPPLPSPPMLVHYTLENPYPTIAAFFILAFAAWWTLAVRPPRRRLAVAGLVIAGVGLAVLAWFIQTPRERVAAAARTLVAAVATGNAPAVDAALLDMCVLEAAPLGARVSKQEIVDRVARDFGAGGRYRAREVGVLAVQASLDQPDFARVHLKVRVTPEATGAPHFSWWRLDYRREGDSWRVSGIAALEIGGVR